MIRVNTCQCDACGRCAEECPYGALYISRAGHAAVLWSLCQASCRVCLDVCPRGCLSIVPTAERRRQGEGMRPAPARTI